MARDGHQSISETHMMAAAKRYSPRPPAWHARGASPRRGLTSSCALALPPRSCFRQSSPRVRQRRQLPRGYRERNRGQGQTVPGVTSGPSGKANMLESARRASADRVGVGGQQRARPQGGHRAPRVRAPREGGSTPGQVQGGGPGCSGCVTALFRAQTHYHRHPRLTEPCRHKRAEAKGNVIR